jgi:hypothetical protein
MKLKTSKMREVLRLEKKEENEKPVEFLESWDEVNQKWMSATLRTPSDWDNAMYRETINDLDYFVCWDNGYCEVAQYRGHLNSGKF